MLSLCSESGIRQISFISRHWYPVLQDQFYITLESVLCISYSTQVCRQVLLAHRACISYSIQVCRQVLLAH